MSDRFLKSLSFFFLFFLSYAAGAVATPNEGVWADSPLGKCYSSLEEYLVSTFGPDYKNDENIQVTNAFDGSKLYKWVRDMTPGINVTRVMFKLGQDQRACAILFIPFASTVREIRDFRPTGLPDKFLALDTPAPGFPGIEILYQLDPETNIYYPKRCLKRLSTGKRHKVNCASVFQ